MARRVSHIPWAISLSAKAQTAPVMLLIASLLSSLTADAGIFYDPGHQHHPEQRQR
jgi:hypothetical protein